MPRLDRDLSWLAFNHRVLQEAMDPSVPVFDRLGFLAIFSSNLDEFFRVRVASLRGRVRLGDKGRRQDGPAPAELLRLIHERVVEHQEQFGTIFREQVVPELAGHGIRLVDEAGVSDEQRPRLRRMFRDEIAPQLHPTLLASDAAPFLRNRAIYLIVELGAPDGADGQPSAYGLVEIPTARVPRFVSLPAEDGGATVLFLDDMIRLHLHELFPSHRVGAAFAVKLSRDAELYLDEEFASTVAEAVRRSLRKRESGQPTRFLFDRAIPARMLEFLKSCFGLAEADLVVGGRYHNLHDLHGFPRCGRNDLASAPLDPVPHPVLERAPSLLDAVRDKDRLLHFPYQPYDHVIRFLQEAAGDPRVEEVWITLYRVAPESEVIGALVDAARNGKRVTAFVEVQARFDEAANLAWAERLEAAGVRTLYSLPGLKVHAKMVLVTRRAAVLERFACLATGNFNERTARVYTDHALLTAHPEITREVRDLFLFLAREGPSPDFRHLLVAPFDLRSGLKQRVEREIEHARSGRGGRIVLKMNSLEDAQMIEALYRAGQAGVKVDLIIRGICCLVPGVPELSHNISARSLVDRLLEHARVFVFGEADREECYLASADWMVRNLSRRVEVAVPIYDPDVRRELRTVIRMQLEDNCKARVLDAEMRNQYVAAPGEPRRRAQTEIYRYLRSLRGPVAADAEPVETPEQEPPVVMG